MAQKALDSFGDVYSGIYSGKLLPRRTGGGMVGLIARNGGWQVNPNLQQEESTTDRMLKSYHAVENAGNYELSMLALGQNLGQPAPTNPNEPAVENGEMASPSDALSFDALQNYRLLQEQWLKAHPDAQDHFNEPMVGTMAPDVAARYMQGVRNPDDYDKYFDGYSTADCISYDYLASLGLADQFNGMPPNAQNEITELFREVSIDPADDSLPANLVQYGRENPDQYDIQTTRQDFAVMHDHVMSEVGLANPFSGEISAESAQLLKEQAELQYTSLFLRKSYRYGLGRERQRQRALGVLVGRESQDAVDAYSHDNPNVLQSVLDQLREGLAQKMIQDILVPSYDEHLRSATDYSNYEAWMKVSDDRAAFRQMARTDPKRREQSIIKRVKEHVDWWFKESQAHTKRHTIGRIGLEGGRKRQEMIHNMRHNTPYMQGRRLALANQALDAIGLPFDNLDDYELVA